ncbi:MAG: polyisoprenoid-binding protein [Ignavibacteria bacterium]|nr:MAG: polyisoprenoid-binding protein [Ignavibacteria bacterium]
MAILLVAFVISTNAQTKWSFDKAHTEVKFEVTHLVISTVTGFFKDFDGTVVTEGDNFENAQIDFTINAASIYTDNAKRDAHLKSPDFFDAEKYPEITFKGKSFTKVSDNKYKLVGDLKIKDVTKEITLDVTYNGTVKDPWGNTKAGFKLTGSVNRFDYGLKWNALIETGGAVVGKDVDIIVNVELAKKK